MRRTRSRIVFLLLALAAALLFVRLGFWQLDRRAERRSRNAERAARLALPRLDLAADSAARRRFEIPPESLLWRRVRAPGTYDYAREIVVRSRSLEGRPGVQILTPLRLPSGRSVLVLRGWLPAADGVHAPIRGARPPSLALPAPEDAARDGAPEETSIPAPRVEVEGIALPYPARPTGLRARLGAGTGAAISRLAIDGETHPAIAQMYLETVSRAVPYPIVEFYILATDPAPTFGALRRWPPPPLGEGPHLGYAIQWFSFALISVIGSLAYLRRAR